ncbi:MAG TPA: hypothetical protein ENH00_00205 [Actinobacteria bacterium]|nr:hypothetical protein [Actinomycetota bacterium]
MSVEHHIARDLLEGYVEDTLESDTRAELEEHLTGCTECRSILEGVEAPVHLGNTIGQPTQAWDEKQLRKTIRRTLFRLVFDAISIWIIGAIALTILSAYAIQPLVVNRGDRVRSAAIATWDLPVLVTPGARVSGWLNNPTPFGRDLSVDLVRPIGDATRPLGTFDTHLGLIKFSGKHGSPLFPHFGGDGSRPFTPERLPVDTVVTVQLQWWEDSISIADAESLQPAKDGARIVWVGFDVTPALPSDPLHPSFEVLGYGTCGEPTILDSAVGSMTSGGGGGSRFGCPSTSGNGVASALQQVRRALDNLASHPELMKAAGPASVALRNADTVAAWLAGNDPAVVSLVITGPTENVAKIMEASGADAAIQLDVDFWNWEG